MLVFANGQSVRRLSPFCGCLTGPFRAVSLPFSTAKVMQIRKKSKKYEKMTDIFCRFKKVPYICTRNQNKNKK